MSIRVFYDETGYRVAGWRKIVKTIREIVRRKGMIPGDLNIIVTSDEELRRLNVQFLEHDYYTDVITFNYNSGDIVNGEIYISLDSVKINCMNYNVSLISEMTRVIIHGVLHLIGYKDETEYEKNEIRKTEDFWLSSLGV